MPTDNALVDELEAITKTFVASIVAAMRRASLTDIIGAGEGAAPAKRGPGRPKGSTKKAADVANAPTGGAATPPATPAARVSLIVSYVKSHPGAGGEAIRKALGLPRDRWAYYVTKALGAKQIRKEGQKRATKYWAA